MNPRIVIRINAGVILAIGLSMLVPLVLSLAYRDGSWASFLLPSLALALVGAGGMWATGVPGRQMGYVSNRDVYLSVTLAWMLGGIPFVVDGTSVSLLDSRGGFLRIGKGQRCYWRIELLQIRRVTLTGPSRRSISPG